MISEHGKRVAEALNAAGFKDDGAITPQAAAERSLILELMTLLVRGHHPDAAPMIAQLHAGARGMTVRLRSLRLLLESDHPDAEPALTAFEHRFGSDPLAMDKWFAVQAATLRQDIPSRIAALEAHPAYQRLNPNRVRALLGSFCAGNLTGFHTADGSGYRLLTDRLAEIDPANPQLAARLAAGLRSWQIFDAKRQAQAKAAMNALFERDGLSPDLKDMLDRMLAV
jgi:aminopeptidase N